MKGQKITEDDEHSLSNVSEQGSVEKALQLRFRTDFTAIYHKIKLFQQLCSFLGSFLLFHFVQSGQWSKRGIAVEAVQDHMACLLTFPKMKKTPDSKSKLFVIIF